MLNYQQMSSYQTVHIALSLPLQRSSRSTIFINTSPLESKIVMLKSLKLLGKKKDDFENIMYASAIEKYVARPNTLENVSLTEYVAFYYNSIRNMRRRHKPQII